jgi:ABC-2 type transport system ATP-binding protein
MGIIEAEGLGKSFGSFRAVDNVTFTVEKGEIFGFLGPNGAGKTTTIRMLTGVLTPDSGAARICGIDVRDKPLEAKRMMGIIPENGTVYSDLTAEQNILWTARFYDMDRATRRKRTARILSDLGLYERKDDVVRTFSKGMRQRVSIACAIVPSPPVLFLDEPTGGLDVSSRRLVIETIKTMNEEGSTVFLTTHNIEEANNLCNLISIIDRGRIIARGSPEKLKKRFDKSNYIEIGFEQPVDRDWFVHAGISRAETRGDKVRLYTEDPDGTVKYCAALAEQRHLRILTIATSTPTLEEAFVQLTAGGE